MSSPAREDNLRPITQPRVQPPLPSEQGGGPPLPASLREDITERQKALLEIQSRLQREAARTSTLARYTRIAVIFLGAFAATREGADRLFPPGSDGNMPVILTYTLMALAITVIGSITTAFRFADKASELNALAAECNRCLLEVDCEMPRDGEATAGACEKARALVRQQNDKIGRVQGKAAKLGVAVRGIRLDSAH
jgi:hypothetical protein